MTNNGVIRQSDGVLLRSGFCDFENDGSFNEELETMLTGIPVDLLAVADNGTQVHAYVDGVWSLVPHTPVEE